MGEPAWQIPEASPLSIIEAYRTLLAEVPTARAWARVEGATVHFFTVVDFSHPTAEGALYEAERRLNASLGPYTVFFEVLPDTDSLEGKGGDLLAVTPAAA